MTKGVTTRAPNFRVPSLADAAHHGRVTMLRAAIDTHQTAVEAWRQARSDKHDQAQPRR